MHTLVLKLFQNDLGQQCPTFDRNEPIETRMRNQMDSSMVVSHSDFPSVV